MVLLVAYCGRKTMEMEFQDLDANYRTNRMMQDELLTSHIFSKAWGLITSKILLCPKIQGYPLICLIVNSIVSRGPEDKSDQKYYRHQIKKT